MPASLRGRREGERKGTTGSPSSKYEYRRTSALLRNILNIRICFRKKPIISVRLSEITLHKMLVTSLLCGPWADLWPFYGLYCKRFSLSIPGCKVYQGWRLQRSGPTDPPKENGRKFAPTAPVASKIPSRKHAIVLLSIRHLASRCLCTESESKVVNLCNLSLAEPLTEPCLNSALPLKGSDMARDSNYSHSGWAVSCSRCFLSRVLMSTGARDCIPPRVWVIWVSGRVATFQQ